MKSKLTIYIAWVVDDFALAVMHIKQYGSTCLVGISPKVVHAPKTATHKKHPTNYMKKSMFME